MTQIPIDSNLSYIDRVLASALDYTRQRGFHDIFAFDGAQRALDDLGIKTTAQAKGVLVEHLHWLFKEWSRGPGDTKLKNEFLLGLHYLNPEGESVIIGADGARGWQAIKKCALEQERPKDPLRYICGDRIDVEAAFEEFSERYDEAPGLGEPYVNKDDHHAQGEPIKWLIDPMQEWGEMFIKAEELARTTVQSGSAHATPKTRF